MTTQALYRHFGFDGALLYVGISCTPLRRTSQHARTARWWKMVARIEIEHHESRLDVMRAEHRAIQSESPRYNIAGVGDITPWAVIDELDRQASGLPPRLALGRPALEPGHHGRVGVKIFDGRYIARAIYRDSRGDKRECSVIRESEKDARASLLGKLRFMGIAG